MNFIVQARLPAFVMDKAGNNSVAYRLSKRAVQKLGYIPVKKSVRLIICVFPFFVSSISFSETFFKAASIISDKLVSSDSFPC